MDEEDDDEACSSVNCGGHLQTNEEDDEEACSSVNCGGHLQTNEEDDEEACSSVNCGGHLQTNEEDKSLCMGRSPKPSETHGDRGARPKDKAWKGFPASCHPTQYGGMAFGQSSAPKMRKTCSVPVNETDFIFHFNYQKKNKKEAASSIMNLSHEFYGSRSKVKKDPLSFFILDDHMLPLHESVTFLPFKGSASKTSVGGNRAKDFPKKPKQYHTKDTFSVKANMPLPEISDNSPGFQSQKNKEVVKLMKEMSELEDLFDAEQSSSISNDEHICENCKAKLMKQMSELEDLFDAEQSSSISNDEEHICENYKASAVENDVEVAGKNLENSPYKSCVELDNSVLRHENPASENHSFTILSCENHIEHNLHRTYHAEPAFDNQTEFSFHNCKGHTVENRVLHVFEERKEPALGNRKETASENCVESAIKSRKELSVDTCEESVLETRTRPALESSAIVSIKNQTEPALESSTEPASCNSAVSAVESHEDPYFDAYEEPPLEKEPAFGCSTEPSIENQKTETAFENRTEPDLENRVEPTVLENWIESDGNTTEPAFENRTKQTDMMLLHSFISLSDRVDSISRFQSQKNKEVVELMKQISNTEALPDAAFGSRSVLSIRMHAAPNSTIDKYAEPSYEDYPDASSKILKKSTHEDFDYKNQLQPKSSVENHRKPGFVYLAETAFENCKDIFLENQPERVFENSALSTRNNHVDPDPPVTNRPELGHNNHVDPDFDCYVENAIGNRTQPSWQVKRKSAFKDRKEQALEKSKELENFTEPAFENLVEPDHDIGAAALRDCAEASPRSASPFDNQENNVVLTPTSQEFDEFPVNSNRRDINTRNAVLPLSFQNALGHFDNDRPCGFDAFLNVENMCQVLWKRKAWSFSKSPLKAILNHEIPIHFLPRNPINIIGGVMIFDDPNCYPRKSHLDSAWNVCLGVHPKHAPSFTDEQFGILSTFLRGNGSPALGCIGYDHSEKEKFWDIQNEVFCKLLGLSRPDKPIVIYIKGEHGDLFGSRLHDKCLEKLQKRCPRDQKIHLHSFTGTSEDVRNWLCSFPNCYFGFSWIVQDFDADQWSAFRSVPMERILIETGNVRRLKRNQRKAYCKIKRPAHLGDLASRLASVREMNFQYFLRQTVENGKRLHTK